MTRVLYVGMNFHLWSYLSRASKRIEFSFDSFHQLKTGEQFSISIRNSTTTTSFFLLEFLKKSDYSKDYLMVLFHFFLCKDYNSYFSLISGKFVQNKITEKDDDQKKNRISNVVRSQIPTLRILEIFDH